MDITVFATYLVAVLLVGMLAARRGSESKRDYFLSGDKLPWWMIGGSIVASSISTHHLVGVMDTAYYSGFTAVLIVWETIIVGFMQCCTKLFVCVQDDDSHETEKLLRATLRNVMICYGDVANYV